MAYSDFNLSRVRETFGLVIEEPKSLFLNIEPTVASDYLMTSLDENLALATAINTEKARSEMVIAPVLLEVRRQLNYEVGFFSGTEFNIDPTRGLTGYCDYILSAIKDSYEVRSPVLMLVEAKNENIKSGLGQCAAEMVAAQMLNIDKGSANQAVYGCVTTGTDWKFMKLCDRLLKIDQRDYFINEISTLLSILLLPFQKKEPEL
ncbi:MAG: hypothetical protein DCE90_14775 [Pseudanabaena sp.]|nr:MAG: hypothetical protein DCE90_14775 [Pseudanabaena sp.]